VSVRAATHALLRDLGMTTIFGNPGSTELRFFKDAPDELRYVLALQESSAVAMADGYAQATGRAAFVNLHAAVGLGHAMGSVFTAMRNQTPLVITAGQQTRRLLPHAPFLYAERASELPLPYVKWSCEPARAQDVPGAIAHAHRIAMQPPRGPAFISIPEDDWEQETEPVAARAVDSAFAGDPAGLAAVAAALARSRRPALVVGPGVDRDGAWDVTVRLAERTGAAVWASPLSSRCSFPEDHPAFAGFLTPSRPALAGQLAGHDVVVVLGAPVFTYHVPAEGSVLPEGTQLFQLVDDPQAAAAAAAGRAVLTTIRLGVEGVLDGLDEQAGLDELAGPDPVERDPAVGRGPRPAPRSGDPIAAELVLHALRRVLPEDAVVVEEAPSHRNAMHEHLPIRIPGGFFAAASGGLGWALPAAVGVALARPERRVACLLGDGSSLYSIQALWTAAQLELPVTFIVLDNRGYVALQSFARTMGIEDAPGLELPGVDLVELAAGFGCPARRVDHPEQVEPALRTALTAPGPRLLDVWVEPEVAALY
jgi:benzoylformate decarboxylase